MSQAEYWHALCRAHAPAGVSIVNDQWCRRTMEEAAMQTDTTGFAGRMWSYSDGSRLIATEDNVFVRGATP